MFYEISRQELFFLQDASYMDIWTNFEHGTRNSEPITS